jgi:hypothetical protein
MSTKRDKVKPKATRATGILTTGMALPVKAVTLPHEAAAASVVVSGAVADTKQWEDRRASAGVGLPDQPQIIEFSDTFSLSTGLYILSAATGSGKTVLSMALTAWANDVGIPATYISCFEPRSPVKAAGVGTVGGAKFTNPSAFWSDASDLMGSSPAGGLVIYDSATLPLKTYASKKDYNNQATFAGGMQPSDRGFVDEGGRIALQRHKCVIINLNSTLVPFVSELAGATEGLISITNVRTFSFQDRSASSKRTAVEVVIPLPYVNAALNHFDFGSFSGDLTGSWKRGFVGI